MTHSSVCRKPVWQNSQPTGRTGWCWLLVDRLAARRKSHITRCKPHALGKLCIFQCRILVQEWWTVNSLTPESLFLILICFHFISPAIMARWGGVGSHRYPTIGFSGDVETSWESLQFQPYFASTAANVGMISLSVNKCKVQVLIIFKDSFGALIWEDLLANPIPNSSRVGCSGVNPLKKLLIRFINYQCR